MNISDLLLKAILGTLTPDEAAELEAWRKADSANERTYRQTTDPALLQREYRRRTDVDVQRPLAEMKARVARTTRSRELAWWRVAAVVAVAVAIGSLAYTYVNNARTSQQISQIQAGSMRASLQVLSQQGGAEAPVLTLDAVADGEPAAASQLQADYRAQTATHKYAGGKDAQPQTYALITPRGGEFRITLEDGTEVWLNAQSQLRYPETFAADERRVEVTGEAYFRVARDTQKPFIVETAGQSVRVLGTEFNIHAYTEDPSVETTLVSGSIALQPSDAGEAQLLLTPGHQAVFSKKEHDIQVHSVDTEIATSWKDGKFVFENQTLQQIMLTLSRWYDFDYAFADSRAAQTVFMGRIPRYADFDDVVAILEGSGGLRLHVEGHHVTISSK